MSKDREGRELGVERQQQDCVRLAEQLGYTYTIFKDNDVSASTLSNKVRPGFDEMLKRVRDGEFSAVVAYSNSRLTRRVVELSRLIEVARETNVRIHTVVSGQHDLDTADGRASMLTIAIWDQAEAERTSERIKRQKQQRAESGEWHGGTPPYGYRAENKNLFVVKREAKLIREAARRLLEDREPLHSIITDWNNSKVPGGSEPKHRTRNGKHWRQSNLRSILRNRSLLGETKAGVKGWRPILDERTFDRLQALFDDPARKVTHSPGTRGGKRTMGGGLAVCSKCGKPLITSIKRDDRNALGCLRRVHGPDPVNHPQIKRIRGGLERWEDTGRVAINHDALEEHVFEKVIEMLDRSPRWEQQLAQKDPRDSKKLDELEDRRGTLRDQRERAQRGFVVGILSEAEARKEVEKIDAELQTTENAINVLLRRPAIGNAISSGQLADWRSWTPGRRRTFLKLLIDRVEVGPHPDGIGRRVPRRSGETDESYQARRKDHIMATVAKRTTIHWRTE